MADRKSPDTNSGPAALLPPMDHREVVRDLVVEKYLLDELTPAARDQFEQHFFDCPECAAELRATSAFLDEAKKQLGSGRRPPAKRARSSWVAWLFRPALVSPAFAAMLALIVYQNFIAPGVKPPGPEVIPSASLVAGNSRGGADTPVAAADGDPVLLSVDVPTQSPYSGYELALMSPTGATLWRIPISAEQAVDTVSVRTPTKKWVAGDYRLIVYGHSQAETDARELAHYRFSFSNDPKLSTRR